MSNKFFFGFFSFCLSVALHALLLFIFSDLSIPIVQSEAREQNILKVALVSILPEPKSEILPDKKELNPELPKPKQETPKPPQKKILPKAEPPKRKKTPEKIGQNQARQLPSAQQSTRPAGEPPQNVTSAPRNENKVRSNSSVSAVASLSDVKVLSRIKPIYPNISRKRKEEGTVVLVARVENGKVSKVSIEKSSGVKALDSSAAKAIEGWKFSSDTDVTVRIPVSFSLKD